MSIIIPIQLRLRQNDSAFDPYSFVYTYPEVSEFVVTSGATGPVLDTALVSALATAKADIFPYLPYGGNYSTMVSFDTDFYWSIYHDRITNSTYANSSYKLADRTYTFTHSGRTFTNTKLTALNALQTKDLDRLCKIHYIRYGAPNAYYTNPENAFSYLKNSARPAVGDYSTYILDPADAVDTRSIDYYLSVASRQYMSLATVNSTLPSGGEWTALNASIVALFNENYYTPHLRYDYTSAVTYNSTVTLTPTSASFKSLSCVGNTSFAYSAATFSGGTLVLTAPTSIVLNSPILAPSHIRSALATATAGGTTTFSVPVSVTGALTLTSTVTGPVNLTLSTNSISAPSITGTLVASATTVSQNISGTTLATSALSVSSILSSTSTTTTNMSATTLSAATLSCTACTFTLPITTSKGHVVTGRSYTTKSASTTLTASEIDGIINVSGTGGAAVVLTMPAGGSCTGTTNRLLRVFNVDSSMVTVVSNTGFTVPATAYAAIGGCVALDWVQVSSGVYSAILKNQLIAPAATQPTGISIAGTTTLGTAAASLATVATASTIGLSSTSATTGVVATGLTSLTLATSNASKYGLTVSNGTTVDNAAEYTVDALVTDSVFPTKDCIAVYSVGARNFTVEELVAKPCHKSTYSQGVCSWTLPTASALSTANVSSLEFTVTNESPGTPLILVPGTGTSFVSTSAKLYAYMTGSYCIAVNPSTPAEYMIFKV